jgi:hypothetical protein
MRQQDHRHCLGDRFAGKPAPTRVGVMPEIPVSFITFTLT